MERSSPGIGKRGVLWSEHSPVGLTTQLLLPKLDFGSQSDLASISFYFSKYFNETLEHLGDKTQSPRNEALSVCGDCQFKLHLIQ